MNLFEKQINERKEQDQQLLENTFLQAAGIVYGQQTADELLDESIIAERAIDEILKYFHLKPVKFPDSITDSGEQLNYSLRYYGVMKRTVLLDGEWYKDAYGVLLTHRKDNGEPVVLLPDKFGTHYSFKNHLGSTVRVNRKTAALFETEAYCFYKPLPHKKLTSKEFLYYIKDCMRAKDWVYLAFCVLLMTAVGLLIPQTVKVLTGDIVASGNTILLFFIGIFILCTVISVQLIRTVVDSLIKRIRGKTSLTVHSALMIRILGLPSDFFERVSPGELAGFSSTVDELCELLISAVAGTGLTALASLLYIVQIFWIALPLGLPTLSILLITIGFGVLSAVVQTKINNKKLQLSAKEAKTRYNVINGIQKIKLSGAEKRFFAKWLGEYSESRRLSFSPPFFARISGVITLAVSLVSSIVLYNIAMDYGVGQSSYIAFAVAFGTVLGAIKLLSDSFVSVGKIAPMLQMLDIFMQTEPEAYGDRRIVSDLSGAVELNNIYFRYGENTPYIFKNLSLKIRPKEYIAVVGKTGCGKSTLVKLLLGLRTPERGEVAYDGHSLDLLDLSSLRGKIGTVMQNGELFQGSIFENITIAFPQATLDDAWKAAEIAGIADDIRAMPMGMHTLVSAGQGGISGGQKQRILIARAVVSQPKILIFDEATSALDNITQRQVSDSLDKMGCTRIIIAHRLSTIRHCDRILVLDNGAVAEEGSYEELTAKNGLFSELVSRQRTDNQTIH